MLIILFGKTHLLLLIPNSACHHNYHAQCFIIIVNNEKYVTITGDYISITCVTDTSMVFTFICQPINTLNDSTDTELEVHFWLHAYHCILNVTHSMCQAII